MDNLMKGRTSFVIAHRLSTTDGSDCHEGQVISSSTHEELLAKNGFYQINDCQRNIEKRIHKPGQRGAVFSLWFIPDTAGCPDCLREKKKFGMLVEADKKRRI